MRDSQRQKVYNWEDVKIHANQLIEPYERLQSLTNYVWEAEGLSHPPKILPMPKNVKHFVATATRFELKASTKGIKTTVLLHELAHCMTSCHDGRSAQHGPRFVGVYIDLLVKYAGLDREKLETSATEAGVKFNYKGRTI